jgi:hypothetical protein
MERKIYFVKNRERYTGIFLLVITVLVVFSIGCGMVDRVLEQIVFADDAAVEVPVTIEQPADVEEQPDTALPANFPH